MTGGRRPNRGRSASAANRSALLRAAREQFAHDGLDASLSEIARRAGVGQGSLYRHFPDRVSLALAVFEDNMAAVAALGERPGASLEELLELITEQTIASVAVIDLLRGSDDDARLRAIADRLTEALGTQLRAAQAAGRAHDTVTPGDLMLAVQMVAALVAMTPAPSRREVAGAAWRLLRPSIFRAGG